MEKINSFRGEYYFLSNFYSAPVIYDGIQYKNSEAAFQAQKCVNESDKSRFSELDPSSAKKMGRRIQLRPDWEEVKVDIMTNIVFAKFAQNTELAEKLIQTGDVLLEEGNTWGDRTWGTVNGQGHNYLGKILMGVREDLKSKFDLPSMADTARQAAQQSVVSNGLEKEVQDAWNRTCSLAQQYLALVRQQNLIDFYVTRGIFQRDKNGFYHLVDTENIRKKYEAVWPEVTADYAKLNAIEEQYYAAAADYKAKKAQLTYSQ